jgi:structural maintenance of chromosome 1
MPMLDNGDTASDEVKVTQVVDLTRSKSRLNMKGATGSRDFQFNGNFASQDMDNGTVHEVNRVEAEPVENQSHTRDGDADVPVVELKGHHRISRYRQRNGSIDGTQSPSFEEWKQAREAHHRRAERSSWPGASAPHMLRTLEDYDDQVYWSDSAEDIIDPDRDNVGKAEELAEELYRDAMELHKSLVTEADMTAAVARKEPSLVAETKETCGDIMLCANSQTTSLAPVLIPAENSESRSVSFSQTSQCSADTPGSVQTEGDVPHQIESSEVLNFRREANETAGAAHLQEGEGADIDHQADEKDGSYRVALEKEMSRLRDSNVRKQVKIDSLQKWRAYYKLELEEKDRRLEQLESQHGMEMKKKEKAVKKMEKQHARDLAHEDIKREELEDKLRGEIKELNLVIEELSGQLYDMEEHLAAGGIPYKPTLNENPGASSKTLLSAVIGVKEAAHTFSRTFMSYLKQHLTKARDLDEQICLESEVIVARPSDYKFLVQSFICRRMFLDFESECFNIDTCMTEIFDIEEHSRACFQEYMTYRNVAETVTLLTDNRPHSAFLREFCFKKFLHIVSESTEEAFFGDFNHSDDICAGRHPSSRFYESYCKLAVSVWLLHRLAFSFQPPARMISVRKGAQFNPTYMESAVPGISSGSLGDGDGSALPFEALVGLMVHPGFRVGSSVIRAQVYLVTT